MSYIYFKYNGSLKKYAFVFSLIIFINLLIFKNENIKSKDSLINYSNISHHFSFMINKNDTALKKLAIALPVDFKIYKKKLIYNTLRTISSLNYNYSLYIIYNKKYPKIVNRSNIFLIKDTFNSVFTAFNLVLDSINDYDYITFLIPGVLLRPSTYDFLNYIEDHDIYQIYDLNKTSFYEKLQNKEQNNNSNKIIYNFINKMPNNNDIIYDKIYKITLLKNNNINFIVHKKSFFYFNLLTFSFAKDLLYINSYKIIHNGQIPYAKFYDNKFQETNIFNKIISANKSITK